MTNVDQLHSDIYDAILSDSFTSCILSSNPCWSLNDNGILHFDNRIYVPDSDTLQLQVLHYCHDYIFSGHSGYNKILASVCQDYVWPNLWDFVKDYVASCTTCKQSKAPRHKLCSTLQQLPILPHLWDSIFMNFIGQLPIFDDFTAILVIVDCISKQDIFILTFDTIDAPRLAKLFIIHVFSKYGVLSHVTSDRGSKFILHFFHFLGVTLDIRLHFTSGYHLKDNRQNQTRQPDPEAVFLLLLRLPAG